VKKEKKISKIDNEVWENYINDPRDIIDKENTKNIYLKKNRRLKFDLHGYSLLQANKKIEDLILNNVNFSEILLITGKGIHSNSDEDVYVSKNLSKLRYSIPEFIKTNEELSRRVISIIDASIKDGGDGALIIKLKITK
tara:strand:- start:2405 stop:2821 length:417 start_codon:yes stop_codon:yes gene_type:complete